MEKKLSFGERAHLYRSNILATTFREQFNTLINNESGQPEIQRLKSQEKDLLLSVAEKARGSALDYPTVRSLTNASIAIATQYATRSDPEEIHNFYLRQKDLFSSIALHTPEHSKVCTDHINDHLRSILGASLTNENHFYDHNEEVATPKQLSGKKGKEAWDWNSFATHHDVPILQPRISDGTVAKEKAHKSGFNPRLLPPPEQS